MRPELRLYSEDETDTSEPGAESFAVSLAVDALRLPRFESGLQPAVREGRLLDHPPWTRSFGPLDMRVGTEGWKFPAPPTEPLPEQPSEAKAPQRLPEDVQFPLPDPNHVFKPKQKIRPRPTGETVLFKDRLLYLLQPPLENLFDGKQVEVPFQPFPYQLEGIAFLMPRHSALLADEMGLGKTAQAILAMRLLFQAA